MARVTRGTEVWYVDPTSNGLTKLVCPIAISGLEVPREQIETTCLEDQVRTYQPGLGTPGAASITVQFDPAEPSHVRLYNLWRESAEAFPWAIGWSDGTSPPTNDSSTFVLPADRSWTTFNASVLSVPFDWALNAVVNSVISLQLSSDPELTPKTA